MARRKCIGSGSLERKNQRILNACHRLHKLWIWYRLIYRERHTVVCVPIWPVTVPIQSDMVPIQLVMVNLERQGFQHCVVYHLLPPTLVYCNQDCSQCIVSYTVQPHWPPLLNFLRQSVDLPLSLVSSSSSWRSQSTRSRPLGRWMTSSSPAPACSRRVWSSGKCWQATRLLLWLRKGGIFVEHAPRSALLDHRGKLARVPASVYGAYDCSVCYDRCEASPEWPVASGTAGGSHPSVILALIVFSVTKAVISLLPNILWCHSLLALDILFPGAITMTKLAFLFWMLSLVSCLQELLPT